MQVAVSGGLSRYGTSLTPPFAAVAQHYGVRVCAMDVPTREAADAQTALYNPKLGGDPWVALAMAVTRQVHSQVTQTRDELQNLAVILRITATIC